MLKTIALLACFHFFLFGATMNNQLNAQTTTEYSQILAKFEQWKVLEYKNGNYAAPGKCKMEIVSADNYKGAQTGIPKDISIYFTDINGDDKIDGLVTFSPLQCDGGNVLMNAEDRVLILSKGTTYITDNSYFTKIEEGLKDGWLSITGASYGTFYGTYYEYKEEDGRCCPSIKKPFNIDYKEKKIIYTD